MSDIERILQGVPETPVASPMRADRRLKKEVNHEIRRLLMDHWGFEQVHAKTGVHMNAIKGVWSALKAEGIIPLWARIGTSWAIAAPASLPPIPPTAPPSIQVPAFSATTRPVYEFVPPEVSQAIRPVTEASIQLSFATIKALNDWCAVNLQWGASYDDAILKLLSSSKRGRQRKPR